VFLPHADDLLTDFEAKDEMEGTLIDFSDSGNRRHAFAVVEVDGKQSVIIPVEKLSLATGTDR
jgi:hypothetical protein